MLLRRLDTTLLRAAKQVFVRNYCTPTASPTPNTVPEGVKIVAPLRLYSESGAYATSFYKTVVAAALEDPDVLGQVEQDLDEFNTLSEDSAVIDAFTSHTMAPQALVEFTKLVADDAEFSPETTAFLEELAGKKKLHLVREISSDYQKLMDKLLQRYTVNVRVADEEDIPPAEEIIELFGLPPTSTLTYDITLDDSVIAGYIVNTEEQLVDASLATQVKALESALKVASQTKADREWAVIKEDLGIP